MPKFKDLTGQKFNRLVVLERAHNSKSNQTQWLCRCDCGKTAIVRSSSLINGHTKSCGCFGNEVRKINTDQTTHGKSHTRLYGIWSEMKGRCFCPTSKIYEYYGGKGVTVCREWLNFETFYNWAITHGYSDSLSIDRIDVNGNYEPSNCRWADKVTQMNNTTANVFYQFNGEKMTLPQIARRVGLPPSALIQRVKRLNIPLEVAVKYPPHQLPPKSVRERSVAYAQ